MRRYSLWILTLGILSMTPVVTMGGLPKLFKFKTQRSETKQVSGTNQKVAEEIAKSLRTANLKGYDIEIEFKSGIATLTGKIADGQQKVKATQLVQRIRGVDRVNNQLELLPNSRNANTKLIPEKRSPILQAGFESEPPFRSAQPSAVPRVKTLPMPRPTRQNGRPADAGTGIKRAAYEFPPATSNRAPSRIQQSSGSVIPMPPEAQATVSSRGPAKQQNQQMAEQIAAALGRAQLTSYDIEINYANGGATLRGAVATPQERAMVTQVASGVPGVGRVDNRLTLLNSYPTGNPALQTVAFQSGQARPVPPAGAQMAPQPGIPAPPSYGHPGSGKSHMAYDLPHLPQHAWPAYASYPNYAQVTYPKEYAASAWPYIGPFYPYPQIPLGWRQVQLEWDDGHWNLNFRPRTEKWWWFMDPENW